jgi:hypothetical protein
MMFIILLFVLAGLVLPGCLDVETKTKVNRDGTIKRTLTFAGDSSRIFRGGYPLSVDSLWASSIQKLDEKKFEFSASRTFSNPEALNEAIRGIPNKTLSVQVELEETFWWFVTDYRYTETYKRWSPFDNVPLTDYVSKAELELAMRHEVEDEPYKTKGDSLALTDAGERFEEWDARNVFESYFEMFLGGVRNLRDPSLLPEMVIARKEDLFKATKNPVQQGKFDTLSVIFSRVLKTRLASRVLAANAREYDVLDQKVDFKGAIAANTYKVNVEMPGIITETNARSIEGNTAQFKDFMEVAYFKDYEMWVASRAINWWAVIVTAVLILFGAVALVVGKRGRGSMSEVRSQKSEVRGQRSEVKSQRLKVKMKKEGNET